MASIIMPCTRHPSRCHTLRRASTVRANYKAAPVSAVLQKLRAAADGSFAESQGMPALSRRAGLAAALLLVGAKAASAAQIPPPPTIGDCPECIGEVNDTLNACNLASSSCISTLNDDEAHFLPPFMYDGDRDAAVKRLIEVATGGGYDAGLIDSPFGISRTDAAAYIAGGVLAVLKGEDMPAQPQRQKAVGYVPFDGVLAEQHTTRAGCNYLRIVFGTGAGVAAEVDDPSSVIDAEFLFIPNDNIVVVRAASRADPPQNSGQLQLSFTAGVVLDRNVARRELESLRKALNWELAPVITDFDPRFNPSAPLWFERLFKPFDERNAFAPSGEPYPERETRLALPE